MLCVAFVVCCLAANNALPLQGRCEALASLQRLTLSVHGMFCDERTRSVKQWPRPNSPPMELLQALLRAVPGAADLDLHMEPEIEALLFDSMLSP